jgi:heme oxygenase
VTLRTETGKVRRCFAKRVQVFCRLLLNRLKAETRLAHDRIERDIGLAELTASRSLYRMFLARFYGFHAAWEAEAGAIIADPALFDRRRKLPLLVRDLRALGSSDEEIEALPLCRRLAPMPNRAAAFGTMYVVEGSTLGGTIIAHHVERMLGLGVDTGGAYFRSYGRDVGRMWKDFGARLLAVSAPDTDDLIVASANQTFECMRAWLIRGSMSAP